MASGVLGKAGGKGDSSEYYGTEAGEEAGEGEGEGGGKALDELASSALNFCGFLGAGGLRAPAEAAEVITF